MTKQLTHINQKGEVSMVDVSEKKQTTRVASASAVVRFPQQVFEVLEAGGFNSKKGSIVQTAVIAGIQAVKKTADLIPLCHQLALSKIAIDIEPKEQSLNILCTVKCTERTGVEMEALTGATVSALTIYDMCKALSQDIVIEKVQLESKTGGKTDFDRKN